METTMVDYSEKALLLETAEMSFYAAAVQNICYKLSCYSNVSRRVF